MNQGMVADAEQRLVEMAEVFPDSPQPHLDLAAFFLRKGDVDAAEKNMQEAVSLDHDNPDMYVALANFYKQINKKDKVIEAFQQGIEKSERPGDIRALLADYYFEVGDLGPARQELEAVFQENAKQPRARLLQAKFFISEKKYTEALGIINDLLTQQPKWGEAYFQKAVAHLHLGEAKLSFNAVNEAVKYSPNSSDVHALLAQHYLLQREFEKAKKEAFTALRLRPNNFRAAILAGKAFLYNNELDDALSFFNKMEKSLPGNAEVLYNKALTLLAQGKQKEGSLLLEKILGEDPGFIPAFMALVKTDMQNGNTDGAVARARKQVEAVPEKAEYQQVLGRLLTEKGQYDEALAHLREARDLMPDNPINYGLIAVALKKIGKEGEAMEEYQQLLQKDPNVIPAYMEIATLYEQSGNLEQAKTAYKDALARRGDFAPAANNLAWLLANEKQPDLGEALRLALVAKEKLPDNPSVADTLGWVHYKRGSYGLALTQFSQAVEELPENKSIGYRLALALDAEGKVDEARKQLVQCLENGEDFPERPEAERLLLEIQKREQKVEAAEKF